MECGEALLKHGYKLKFFNSINFSKSMKYNPMAYIHSEKDILKLVTALKNIRKYIDMVLNKQQLSAPGGKAPEKKSVLKKLEEAKAAQPQKKAEQKNHTQEL